MIQKVFNALAIAGFVAIAVPAWAETITLSCDEFGNDTYKIDLALGTVTWRHPTPGQDAYTETHNAEITSETVRWDRDAKPEYWTKYRLDRQTGELYAFSTFYSTAVAGMAGKTRASSRTCKRIDDKKLF
ncbi:MAG: hypothetical protein ABSE69_03140 [Roseiarcus sp.]|jgi:hypothetical protein